MREILFGAWMATFGSFSLLIALVLAAYSLLAGATALWALSPRGGSLAAFFAARRLSAERLAETARRAGVACFWAVSAASLALVWAALANDFALEYIVEHSNRALPVAYKLAALWAGQEGSLLFWAWLLAAIGFVLRLRHRTDVRLFAHAGAILAAIQLFFLILVNFVARPFTLLQGPRPEDGFGLNPLLQYPEMVIHPPMLYLGYVGFAAPFAFALAALIMRYPGEKWIRITRVWTLSAWLFLTCGIFLGMHWAYAVLGWGGYWGWDPVENASFMPWLTGTAFLHSVMVQEKRGMMKSWNVWLVFTTFLLTLLGTWMTRSGVVSSVHAFAESSIGYWFLGFIVLALAVCIFFYTLNRDHLRSEREIESLVSRESSFLFNNLILLAACLVILWGSLFPVLSEAVHGSKIAIGAPWYNAVAVPIGLFLLLLMGVGPLLPWRSVSLRGARRSFVLPALALWIVLLASIAVLGWPWKDGALDRGSFYAMVVFALAAAVVVAMLSEFARGVGVLRNSGGCGVFSAALQLIGRNRRRYGGYLIHLGVAAAFIGLAGAAFNQSSEGELALHGKLAVGPYTLECLGFTQDSNLNFESDYAVLDVWKGGQRLFQMTPERRVYMASQQPQTMVAVHSTLFWDLYVVYEGTNPDSGQPVIKAFLNPLVSWIWAGMIVMLLGAVVALTPGRKEPAVQEEQIALAAAPAAVNSSAEGGL
jgi:cytochrome c-type biogenesis protein CcmF